MDAVAKLVEAIFAEALRRSDRVRRAAYVVTASGDDARVRDRVEALLRAHDDAGNFMAPDDDRS